MDVDGQTVDSFTFPAESQGYAASGYIPALLEWELEPQGGNALWACKFRSGPGKGWYAYIDWKGKMESQSLRQK